MDRPREEANLPTKRKIASQGPGRKRAEKAEANRKVKIQRLTRPQGAELQGVDQEEADQGGAVLEEKGNGGYRIGIVFQGEAGQG